jgi:hypothetical protein
MTFYQRYEGGTENHIASTKKEIIFIPGFIRGRGMFMAAPGEKAE